MSRFYGQLVSPTGNIMANVFIIFISRANTDDMYKGLKDDAQTDDSGYYDFDCPMGIYDVYTRSYEDNAVIAGTVNVPNDNKTYEISELLTLMKPEDIMPDTVAKVLQYSRDARQAADEAAISETNAGNSAQDAAASAASAADDATKTAADRTQTGLDRAAASASATSAANDALKTAADRTQTGIDKDAAAQSATNANAAKQAAEYAKTAAEAAAVNSDTVVKQGAYTFIYSPDKSRRLVLQNNAGVFFQNGAGINIPIIPRFDGSLASQTNIYADDAKTMRLVFNNTGTWGLYSDAQQVWKPLGFETGGTAATTAQGACDNLNAAVGNHAVSIPDTANVLDFFVNSGRSGFYSSGSGAAGGAPGNGWKMMLLHVHGTLPNGNLEYGYVRSWSSTNEEYANQYIAGTWQGWIPLNQWLGCTDTRISQWLDFSGVLLQEPELIVRIGPTSIDVQGIIRKNITSAGGVLFSVKAALFGRNNVQVPYAPAVWASASGNMGIGYTGATAANVSVQPAVVIQGLTAPIGWAMVNTTIRFLP